MIDENKTFQYWWHVSLTDGKKIGDAFFSTSLKLFNKAAMDHVKNMKTREGFKNPVIQSISYLGCMDKDMFYNNDGEYKE